MSLISVGSMAGDRYTVQSVIGRGGMQEVYLAHDETLRRLVALKVPQDDRAARKFKKSAVLSAKVNHPNVAKTLDYFEDETKRFYMVEEFVDGLDLRKVADQFSRLDVDAVTFVLHHLARGLAASHRAGVVHRDLKPSNIMIVGGLNFNGVKITDFGIAKMAEHEVEEAIAGGEETTKRSTTMMGQLAYVAPEIIDSPHEASKASDVWAIAAIAWELLAGAPPFGKGLQALKNVIKGTRPSLAAAVTAHPQFGDRAAALAQLIQSVLVLEPTDRPSAEELAAACDDICYLAPTGRKTGTVENYPQRTFGFIAAEDGGRAFFHTKNVIGDTGDPVVGTRVWFSEYEGSPHPRAIPLLPLKESRPPAAGVN